MPIAVVAQLLADRDGWGHMDGWGSGWMWLWGSLIVLSWVALIAAAIWFLGRRRHGTGSRRAQDILDERYARGELTTEEYRERIDQLS